MGKLLRWGNIESFEWADELRSPPGLSVLKVHVRRLLKALPAIRILVPNDRREVVNAVLSRYLSDWPTSAEQGYDGNS